VTVRIRRSAALVIGFEGGVAVGESFLARRRMPLSPLSLSLLAGLAAWRAPAEVFPPGAPRAEVAAALLAMIDAGLIVVEGSAAGELDERYARDWRWGASAASYHFGIKDPDYQPPHVMWQALSRKLQDEPQPPLFETNEWREVVPLGRPAFGEGLLGEMARRRSWRGFDPSREIAREALRDCLFAGLGIVAFADTAVGERDLPLKMAPSGGARNPFEAYVVARAVAGVPPGAYHYAGVDGTLGLVRAGAAPLDALLGGQEWAAGAAAVVFLVAHFARTTWKYAHATGFRVVLLEAGHIAQNVLLAATARGLASAPTCAISDRAVEELFGLDRVRQAALHAVALGAPSARPSSADLPIVRPLPA
jgi:SagB-type dehydrogenase family enzyme